MPARRSLLELLDELDEEELLFASEELLELFLAKVLELDEELF